jgi:hypothetical protein
MHDTKQNKIRAAAAAAADVAAAVTADDVIMEGEESWAVASYVTETNNITKRVCRPDVTPLQTRIFFRIEVVHVTDKEHKILEEISLFVVSCKQLSRCVMADLPCE